MSRLRSIPSRLAAAPARLRTAPKVAEGFYQSKAWHAAKAAKRREGNVWCAQCGSTDRLILDHIIERKDGGADLDPSNLEWLCHRHHAAKTAKARAKRASGV